MFSDSHAAPDSVWFTDEFGNPSTVFIARDTGVLTVNALVTDPFGIYDIAFPSPGNRAPNIQMDLVAPDGVPILANVSMVAVSGLSSALNGTVSYTLRIPDMAGTHSVTVRVRDNSGNVFPLTASLAIVEGFPLTVTVVDAGGHPVSGAWVQVVTSNDVPYDFKLTNGSGIAVFKVPKGTYKIQADYTTTYLLTQFSTSKETQAQATSTPVSVTLTFSDYPLPFASTVLFLIVLIVAAAVVATSFVVLALRRMGMEGISRSLSSGISRIKPRKVQPAPKYCIYCGSSLKSGATVCASCGRIVPVMRL